MNVISIGMGKHPCNDKMASAKCSADDTFNKTEVFIDHPILKINREESTGEESIGQNHVVNKARGSSNVVSK